jgi:DNA polymerase III epsilon subunit-like protein
MSTIEAYIYKKVAAQTAYGLLQNDFVILDTETTGLDGTARVVSLAMIDRDGRELIDTLINPGRPIPRDATRIHGITDAHVKNAPSMAVIAPQLEDICSTRPTYIYNAEFDLKMLYQHMGRMPSIMRHTCVMKLYAQFKGEKGSYGWKWHKLTVACTQLGVREIEARAHSAMGDCLRTLAVLRAMAEWYVQNK